MRDLKGRERERIIAPFSSRAIRIREGRTTFATTGSRHFGEVCCIFLSVEGGIVLQVFV